MSMSILLTGGAGYIGSHTALVLLQAGYDVVVLDDLSNSSPLSLQRVEKLTGRTVTFVEGDVRDRRLVKRVLEQAKIRAVIHFAGAKSVGESAAMPLAYYDNNVGGTVALCQAMQEAGVSTLVFSSSATVYGDAQEMPLRESAPTQEPTNPYGRSKLMIEGILRDLQKAEPAWAVALLRYFNPVGAHQSGEIGEDPNGIPNNLLPYITQVAVGRLEALAVYGGDYPTPDGTGIRDYIHVMDLARGHLKAMQAIMGNAGLYHWNLGAGRGYSVLEVVDAFKRVTGREVAYNIVARREGDIARCWADATKALEELDWRCEHGLEDILRDAWRWQTQNPRGFPRGQRAADHVSNKAAGF